jgi:hypothetical protein
MGKFSGALGVLEIKKDDYNFELKPVMGDVRRFRNIMMEGASNKDKNRLYDKMADYIVNLIHKHYNEENIEEIKEFVELYLNPLFEEFMVSFKWTTREELEKSKKESLSDLKKKIEQN